MGWLGAIDTAYLVAYAAGQFLNGALGDRFGARRLIAFGMLLSAGMSAIFGASSSAWLFLIAFGANGVFQATGWPNNVKTMGNWFGRGARGRIMGIWSTNYQLGGLVAIAAAAYLLTHFGWRSAFFVPAAWTAGIGLLVLLLLVEKPQSGDARLAVPEASADPAKQRPREINVGLDAQGRYKVDREPPFTFTSVEALAEMLKRAAGDTKDPIVVINADAQATHQSVVHVMEAARAAGYVHITFATQASPAAQRK